MLKSEKRELQKFKKRYGPRRHKMLGINKWTRKRKALQDNNEGGSSNGNVKCCD